MMNQASPMLFVPGSCNIKKPLKRVVFSILVPPADIIVYIILSDLLLFMDFIKRKTIKKY